MTLPMGWKESPPYFSMATEMVADLANEAIRLNATPQPHQLETTSESHGEPEAQPNKASPSMAAPSLPTPIGPSQHGLFKKPIACWDVHVDDFIGLAQGNRWRQRKTKRLLLHSLDSVFQGLESTNNPHRQEPASVKKMPKGEARWSTRKIALGWIIDTIANTIELPAHRQARLLEVLDSIKPTQKRVAIAQWHKLLGELRSMVTAIPGGQGLFSTLQEAFRHPEKGGRLRLRKHVHDFLQDFRWLASDISNRPTRIAETIPLVIPDAIGANHAAGAGMGGVLFVPTAQGRIIPLFVAIQIPSRCAEATGVVLKPHGNNHQQRP